MASLLEHEYLRTAIPKDVAIHLRHIALSRQVSPEHITQQLLEAVQSESLPPMVYALWTSSCPDHSATVAGMRQSHSIIVRSSAIRNFRRRFRTTDCESLWRAFGGTDGIVRLLSQFSVVHVKEFCKAVARCSTSKNETFTRRTLVTDLVQTLTSGTKEQNPDERSLLHLHAKMIYTCTTDFKDAWISQQNTSDLDMAKVYEIDVALYRQQCLESLTSCKGKLDRDFGKYSPLFLSIPQEPDDGDRSISASMAFAVQILEAVRDQGISIQDSLWLNETICSLVRRMVHSKTSSVFALRALDAIAHCVQQQFGNKPAVSNQKWQRHAHFEERLWLNIVRLWRRDPALYESKLTPLLRTYKGDLDLNCSYGDRGDIQHRVLTTRSEDRYRFLRWTLVNHHQYKVDIDDVDQLKRKDLEPFSEELLLSLPHPEAIRLFDRCESANPNKHKLKIKALKYLGEAGDQARVHLLRLRLLEDSRQVTQEGQERTLHCRQMAEDSGSQPIRSAWINASMYYAVASRSMDTFQDTVIWARRFSRDPKTAMELYGSYPFGGPFFVEESTAMFLSGIPIKLSHDTTTSNISQNVRKANQIVLDLIQSAILVQNDPSFKRRHWEQVFLLPKRVIMSRLSHVNALQSRMRLTDNEVFSCVWQDTLDMLIKAEEIGQAEDNEGLEYSQIEGPLAHDQYSRDQYPLPRPSVATARFIDELSARRDSLWARQRVTREPAITTLESPWPRGLPVQSLWFLTDNEISGYDLAYYRRNSDREDNEKKRQAWGRHLQHRLPLLEQRVKEIVFLQPEHALRPVPTDAETQLAIGSFVDSYPLALKMYLTWCDPAEREKRIQAAWTHATEALRGERMSILESRHFWKETFSDAGAKPTASMLDLPSHSDPQLPYQEEVTTDPVEWNPGPDASLVGVESRSLDALIIDWFRNLMNVTQNSTRVSLRSTSVPNFWNLKRYSPNLDERRRGKIGFYHAKVPRKAREAFVAAALLLVEGRAQAGSKILGQPFPSTVAPRFPAVFLDTEVLDSRTPSDKDVEMILERFLPAIPPTLLKTLADNLIGKSLEEATPSSNLRKWASVILRLLVLSDKPELATDMIVRIVLETPGETPWHRILLHPGILKRLPPIHARKVILDLTNGVVQRLSQQDQDRYASKPSAEQATAPGPYTPGKPTVKVTTIKMLAQILKDASFLGDAFIMDALVSLFQNATHIHVRATIVDSLASLLCTSRSVKLQEHIVSTLETTVVPIAAELNERSPMTEERWKAAEQAGEPPEVYSDANLAPMCSALVDVVKLSKHDSMRTHNLVQRILLPLIRKSRENNTRWSNIFLHKHNASDLAAQVPGSPVKPQLLELLLTRYTSHMPAAEFANLSDLLILAVDPPKQYAELATRLKGHPQAYKQHAASHWLRTTDATLLTRPSKQTHQELTSLLQTSRFANPEQATLHDLVTPAHLQAHERKVLEILLANFPSRPEAWEEHAASYKPPLKDKSEDRRLRWQEACSPVLWHAFSLIKNLRTKAWQRDPHRQPSVLPDTFQLRLWLLPYPQLFPPSEHDEKLELFVHDVRACVQRLATKNKPYHERLDLLKGAVVGCPRQDWTALALRFGTLKEGTGRDLTLAECLCVELADLLLDDLGVASKEDVRYVRDMLDVWTQCFDEEVRRRAHERLKELQDELGLGEATAAEKD